MTDIVTDYFLVKWNKTQDFDRSFSDKVRDYIGEGWPPQGGPFVHGNDLCQAMVITDKTLKVIRRRPERVS